jgi:steroid Delta-isomerase
MSDGQEIVAAIDTYVDAFNRRDRERWLALFAPDALHEDPVGRPPRRGRAAIAAFWDAAFARAETIEIERNQVIVGGREAVMVGSVRSVQAHRCDVLDIVDHFTFGEDGSIAALRAFAHVQSRTAR